MTAARTRALIERYFELAMGGDPSELFAPDIVWHLPRTNPMGTPIVGLEAVRAMLARGFALYDPEDMRSEVHRIIAGDDGFAAVRLTFHTRTAAGQPYAGEYQLQFECRDGAIAQVWESPDTLYQERMKVFADYAR